MSISIGYMPDAAKTTFVSAVGVCGVALLCFFFNDTATTEIYTLSLHDALPISHGEFSRHIHQGGRRVEHPRLVGSHVGAGDAEMKVGAAMHAGIRIARVIEPGSSSVAGPIPVQKGNFDRVKARRGENHIRIHGYVAVAAIVVDDVDPRA